MKSFTKLFTLGLAFIFICSCSITKRKYESGYYVEWKHVHKNAITQQSATENPQSVNLKNKNPLIIKNPNNIENCPVATVLPDKQSFIRVMKKTNFELPHE